MTRNSTRAARLKTLRSQRTDLCHSRRVWELKAPDVLPIDLCIGCDHAEPEPGCEGCAATLYRADRLADIAAGIKAIDDEVTAITGTPYMTAKPKQAKAKTKHTVRVEQLPLFA